MHVQYYPAETCREIHKKNLKHNKTHKKVNVWERMVRIVVKTIIMKTNLKKFNIKRNSIKNVCLRVGRLE